MPTIGITVNVLIWFYII